MPPPLNGRFSSWLDTPLADGNTLLVGSAMFDNPSMEELNRRLFPAGQKDYVFTSNYLVALTVLSGEKWTVPAYLKFEDFKTASLRNDFELAPGNRVLLLSLITEESVGKRDLYVSFRKPDGTWSAPKDMGTPVNSPEDEIGPFIAADGVSLYFSSDRPGGYGGADIYLCKRLDDTWLRWSEPVNLGPDINTSEEEANLTVDGQGRYAFLSQGVMMQEDIYVFELPMKIRPTPVAFIRGRAHDPANNPVPATVSYERLRDGAGAGEANANRITGHYQIALPIGENYGFRADAAGYIAVSDKIDLSQAKPGEEFERDLLLVPVKIGATIRLNNVFFEFAKTKILPESKVELERLVAILNQYPKMEIEVAGHTDNVGDDRSNQVLSEGRAAAILQYLLDRGIALARLGAKGYGESMPVAPNDTDEHRQLNRRVEFIIRKME
jgi:outer membrane protein OmpA-like peptidoglycan-associated protein